MKREQLDPTGIGCVLRSTQPCRCGATIDGAADVLIESENDAQREVAGQVQEFLRSAAASTVDGRTAAAWLRAAQHTPDTSGV
ncbi:MAG: hypothetical protein EBX18_00775, partial [Actinobacteria bacterium]|nr:hypothetical protein [Actinomycetota bacterium]